MTRYLCMNLLSRIRRNDCSIASKPFLASSFSRTYANPFFRQFFSHHSTPSNPYFSKSCSPTGFSGRFRNGFFSSGTIVSRRFLSNTNLKGQSNIIWIHTRRKFHSFDSQYGGWKTAYRRLPADGVVIGLIVINVAVFILWRVADPLFMVKNFMISVDNVTSGRLHTLITSAFSHRDMWHITANMVGLYFFGMSIGRTFGPDYLLKLYLSGAVVGSIFYLAYHAFIAPHIQGKQMLGINPSKIPGLGASGAVNAIMLLDIFLFPTKTLYFDFIIPVPAILLGIFMIGKDLLRILEGDPQVSGSAHLGGATVAAIAWARSRRGRFGRF